MLTLLLLPFMLDPIKVVQLENNGRYLTSLDYNQIKMGFDGTVLARTKYQLWHWDTDGKLMRRLAQKGSGPGEVQGMGAVFWNGEHYWVIDNQALFSSLFDKNGKFLSRRTLYFRQLIEVDGQVFGVDYSRANQFQGNFPRNLQELNVKVMGDELVVERTDLLFNKVTRAQQNLEMNFKLLWVAKRGDTYLVVNQLEPRMYLFDEEARRKEASKSIEEFHETDYVTLNLPHFEAPPESFTKQRTRRALMGWWRSWSRINFFTSLGENFLVCYEVPSDDSEEETTQALAVVDINGRLKKPVVEVEGFAFGVHNNHVKVFREGDSDDFFEYFVDTYDLGLPPS